MLGLDQITTLNRHTTYVYTVAGADLSESTELCCVPEALVLAIQSEMGLEPKHGALEAPNHRGCGWG